MSAAAFLDRLERVKQTGPGRWIARCPAHDDKGPSLSIAEKDDERVLVKCFAGCSTHEVLTAVGLDFDALFPPRGADHRKPERRAFPASDVLRCIAFEALVVAAAGAALLSGQPFTQADRERMILAVSRIQEGLTAAGVRHV